MRPVAIVMVSLLIPAVLLSRGYGLRDLIESANSHNQLLKSSELKIQAKQKEVDAQESAFWPTLDIGASYGKSDPYSVVMPGEVLTGYAVLGFDLYDGGRKRALTNAKAFQHQSSIFEKQAFEKSLTLNIVNNYYTIKKLRANLNSLQASLKELGAQIERIKRFSQVGMATEEDVDRLQAAYDNNAYLIENTKLAILTQEEDLWLNSGIEAKELKNDHFAEPRGVQFEAYEKTRILESTAEALKEQAHAIDSGYLPQVRVEDTYNKSDFNQVDTIPGFGGDGLLVDEQNKLMLSAHMRLFDHGRIRKEREAVQYQKMSVDAEKIHSEREQRMNFRVAGSRLKTIRTKLKSAKSGLRASRSTYQVIVKKFETGLVDNIAYLDALKKQTTSEALYKATQYDYEIAKSIYYFYAGKNPREYIQ